MNVLVILAGATAAALSAGGVIAFRSARKERQRAHRRERFRQEEAEVLENWKKLQQRSSALTK